MQIIKDKIYETVVGNFLDVPGYFNSSNLQVFVSLLLSPQMT